MAKKKGGVEKRALNDDELKKVMAAALLEGEEAVKVITILRWTGMHVSILAEPIKYDLRVDKDSEDGLDYIMWDRTKKTGKAAHTEVMLHQDIDFDIKAFIKELCERRKARRPRRISRQYFYRLVHDVGVRAEIPDLAPMSFRHTFGVDLANRGADIHFIIETMNCSMKTARTYMKRARKTRAPVWKRVGYMRDEKNGERGE